MKSRPVGNGSGKFDIHQEEMGGWVRVYPDEAAEAPAHLAMFLSHALTEWFRQRPHLHLRCVAPIAKNGSTVELHAWYDQHVFPDLSGDGPEPS